MVNIVKRRHSETNSDMIRNELERFMSDRPCPTCRGRRLKPESLSVTVDDKSIANMPAFSVREAARFFAFLAGEGDKPTPMSGKEQFIGRQILKEIRARLGFLMDVGLEYLTINRTAATLAGGEAQRIRLATQIGSSLMGVLYILDEPSIGLHQRDNARLINTLLRLRDLGNTLIVVEHDEETMQRGRLDDRHRAGRGRAWRPNRGRGHLRRDPEEPQLDNRQVPHRRDDDSGAQEAPQGSRQEHHHQERLREQPQEHHGGVPPGQVHLRNRSVRLRQVHPCT